jgi:hypothetical protein
LQSEVFTFKRALRPSGADFTDIDQAPEAMSLVQHVSAIDGVDREIEPDLRDNETITTYHDESLVPIRRKISYDVLHERQQPVTDDKSGTPAYEVSTAIRLGMQIRHYFRFFPFVD